MQEYWEHNQDLAASLRTLWATDPEVLGFSLSHASSHSPQRFQAPLDDLEVRVVPYRLYGDGAEVQSGQNFEAFSMVLPCSVGHSSMETRIVSPSCASLC